MDSTPGTHRKLKIINDLGKPNASFVDSSYIQAFNDDDLLD